MTDMLLILAGNEKQANDFARRNSIPRDRWLSVRDSESLNGVRNAAYVCVGTWYRRTDVREMQDRLEALGIARIDGIEGNSFIYVGAEGLEEATLAMAQATIQQALIASSSYLSSPHLLRGGHNLTIREMARALALCGYEVQFTLVRAGKSYGNQITSKQVER